MQKTSVGFVWGIVGAAVSLLAYLVVMAIGLNLLSFTLGLPWLGKSAMLIVTLIPLLVLPSRRVSLPLPMQLVAEVTIAAQPAAVWRWIYPNPSVGPSDPEVRRVAVDTDGAGGYVFHYHAAPKAKPADRIAPRKARIEALDLNRQLTLHFPDPNAGPADSRALRKTDYLLQASNGGTKLVVVQHMDRIAIRQVLQMVFRNPAKVLAARLKAQCEGTWVPDRLRPVPGELGQSADFA